MDIAAAREIGAGIAVIALAGVGIGLGNIFSTLVSSIARNPASRPHVFGGHAGLCADRSYRSVRSADRVPDPLRLRNVRE